MDEIKREDLFRYSYYGDNGKHIAVLNVDNLKKILGVDELVFEEDYRTTSK